MAISKEREFELEIVVVVSGFGKTSHWEKLGREIKRALAQRIGDCVVEVTRVRLPGGRWYPAKIGVVPEPEGEWDVGE